MAVPSTKPRSDTKPRRRPKHEAELIKLIYEFEQANDAFLDLAEQSADFEGDPEFDAKFQAAQDKLTPLEKRLYEHIKPGFRCPVVCGRTLYKPGHFAGQVHRQQVNVIEL